jgi:Tol biopolymer transport system component
VHATFSPDGRSVAFVRFVSEVASDLYVVPTVGGEPRRLTHDERPITSIAFDADGRSLLYSANRDGQTAVWRVGIDARDSVPRKVYETSHGISGLTMMPAARSIVVAESDQDLNLWTTPTDGSAQPRQIVASTRLDALPRYSPDNKRIAFVSDRSGESELWVSDADGNNSARLTQLGDIRGIPSWSPNGEQVAVEREVRGRSELWVADVARRVATRVPSSLRDAVAPNWSADGRSIYVSSRVGGTWQVFSVAMNGIRTQLTASGGMGARPTADGRSILFAKPYVTGLWRLDLATRAETLVTSELGPGDCTNWDVTAGGVYFVKRGADGRQSIVALPFSGRSKIVVANVRVPVGSGGLSVTSDGRAVVYAQVDRRDGDLVMVSPR